MRLGFFVGRVAGGVLVGLAAGAFAVSASAADTPRGLAIARSNACMGCHAVDRKLVGPSFQQVAEKYKGNAGAPAMLARKVKDGGSGVWGAIPMPAHPAMSDADIRIVVDWVLAGAPAK
ncbi:c-type cytochrome [Paraburkholderia sp. CNPSo 3157]|uniref:C-type cytochrome n=1 Tax=Paraburkholderia franconis TaxID=2654983 RepID=A0A7X1NBH2_9BURK|nr:c-type cytochrome [Paraburkholderia franconis]MPW18835.1 c-type cytochrome [Paraburkholderia franconis]